MRLGSGQIKKPSQGNLRQQSFRIFIPRTIKNVTHARKIEMRKAALFPGYGFVEADLKQQRWRSIDGTRGVLHLMMARETPMPLPTGVVEEFLEFSDADGVVDLSRGLAVGAEVRLRASPFSGAIGIVTGLDEKGRVEVLLHMMNGQIRVRTVHDTIEAIELSALSALGCATKSGSIWLGLSVPHKFSGFCGECDFAGMSQAQVPLYSYLGTWFVTHTRSEDAAVLAVEAAFHPDGGSVGPANFSVYGASSSAFVE